MLGMFNGFNGRKLKAQLKMAVSRFQITSNKRTALIKQEMRNVARLLAENPPREENARIKAEALIREDNMIEAYDILSLECELLSERIKLLEFSKDCPLDLVACISTLIYASPRVDIAELQEIRKQFRAKYGKKFEEAALNNEGGVLNERVVTKLSIQPPAAYLVQTYLERICEREEVHWKPTIKLSAAQMVEPMAAPSGFSVPVANGSGLGMVQAATGLEGNDQDSTGFGNPPGNNGNNNNNGGWGGGDGGMTEPPEATATPILPTAPSPSATSVGVDFAEPDIYIPAAPGHSSTRASVTIEPMGPPETKRDSTSTSSNNNNNNNDDDNSNPPSSAGGGAGNSTDRSYEDIAARFDNLKHL
eukprot:CAMPEP_0198114196 /NCGR_PEP_ID=MMETSP1442-20131203/5649_1 /TAXON_ID= /ORGANISM="Craspedostauros australis, Strain CCMP3328" /LENGTH=361 /DNA_ID=CAMNT_0043771455 /DNA_START=306 /DNA_END=1391 /DNA_ORIENTATION=+